MSRALRRVFIISLALAASIGAQSPETRKVERVGFDLHYRVYGAGVPVAILSGGPGMDDNVNLPLTPDERKQIALLGKGGWPTAASIRLTTPGLFYDREKARAFLSLFRDEGFHGETHRLLNLAQHAENDLSRR